MKCLGMHVTPPSQRLRGAVLALALIMTAVAGQWWQRSTAIKSLPPPPNLQQIIPEEFARWRVDANAVTLPVSLSAEAKARSLYTQTLERVYVDDQQRRIMLSLSYGAGQGDALQAHRPEFCYQAQGFAIQVISDAWLNAAGHSVPIRRLEASRPGRNEPVSYWLMVGDDATLPGLARKLAQLRQGVSGKKTDSLLVRVSSISQHRNEAFGLHDRFIADLLSAMPMEARKRMSGETKRS